MGGSFLDSLLTNQTRGLAALLATCEDAELKAEITEKARAAGHPDFAQEAPVAVIVNPDTILDGRTFRTHTGGYAEGAVTVHATTQDDVTWALTHLGQYVDGQRGARMFRAYVHSVSVTADKENLITVLAEPL